MSKFSTIFKELRKRSGLSQQELADKLKTSKSSVNMYERGEREPGIEMLETIADFFNVNMDYLIGKSNISKTEIQRLDEPAEELVNGDPELTEYLEELKNRPEMRMMFSLTKNATKADVEKAVKIVETLLGKDE